MYQELKVEREHEFFYRICFHEDFSQLLSELEKDGITFYRACIVTDSVVGPLYAGQLADILKTYCNKVTVLTVTAGEENKHLDTVLSVYEHLIEESFDRKDILFALGGGVVGDLTGYAAATYLRGIRFVQIPTTLLAQVDSSIGGKTGVDFKKYKNMVGAFHQPSLVYMNSAVLTTLNDSLFACGMAEVIKAGLLADADFFRWLFIHAEEINQRDPDFLKEMIYRSCRIKRDVVEQDPKEQGVRATLNLGHTIGHAIEKRMNFSMLHGQCVAVGYVAAAYLSLQRGLIAAEDLAAIEKINCAYHLPNYVTDVDGQEILQITKSDKKMSRGRIKFILLKQIGEAVIDSTLSDEELLAGISYVIRKQEEYDEGK